jgi:hypothetical protein
MDEDSMGEAVVRGLRLRAVDVLTAAEAGMIGRNDADHLRYAAAEQRVLCTFNARDYWALHHQHLTQGETHAGIILMPQQRYGVGVQLRRLLRLARTLTSEAMINPVQFLGAWEPVG